MKIGAREHCSRTVLTYFVSTLEYEITRPAWQAYGCYIATMKLRSHLWLKA